MRLGMTARHLRFQEIVDERGQRQRALPFKQLRKLTNEPTEHLTLESRSATIGIIVDPLPSLGIRVVVQGFLSTWPFRGIKRVALDGFHKYPDETISPMAREEFWEFD